VRNAYKNAEAVRKLKSHNNNNEEDNTDMILPPSYIATNWACWQGGASCKASIPVQESIKREIISNIK